MAISDVIVAIGDWSAFAGRTIWGVLTGQTPLREIVPVCVAIGVQSAGVVLVTGAFIGMVLAVQTYSQFHALGLESALGTVINVAVIKELGPVFTGIMLAGRIGSSMAAELGTMRVTEQIDALSCLGVNPIHYLVGPRFLACLFMIPLLSVLAIVTGIGGGAVICLNVFGIEPHHYWTKTQQYIDLWDLSAGMIKPFFFGAMIGLVSCHRGFHCRAGAVGVGQAATEAFVYSFLAILVLDFFLVLALNGIETIMWPDASAGM